MEGEEEDMEDHSGLCLVADLEGEDEDKNFHVLQHTSLNVLSRMHNTCRNWKKTLTTS